MERNPNKHFPRIRLAGAARLAVVAFSIFCFAALGCGDTLAEARELERQGDLDGAVSLYLDFLERDPRNLEALSGAATGLLMMGRYDEALVLEELIVSLDPRDVLTRVELGFNYLNHQHRPGDAARMLRAAAELEPSAKHLNFLAQAQIASGDLPGAEATLRTALETDSTYLRSYDLLIGLLLSCGRNGEVAAVEDYASRNGVELEPSP